MEQRSSDPLSLLSARLKGRGSPSGLRYRHYVGDVASWAQSEVQSAESVAIVLPEHEDGVPSAWYVACLGKPSKLTVRADREACNYTRPQ